MTPLRILVYIFLLSTYKTLPFAYVIRFYHVIVRNLLFHRSQYNHNNKLNTFGRGVTNPLDVFKPAITKTYVSPLEIDMYLHKSNSTYFIDLDIARTDLVTKVFQKLFFRYFDNDNGHFPKAGKISNFPYVPVAAVETHFKHELRVFQPFEIHSQVLAWDKKWLFILSKFVTKSAKGDEKICAITITKYVFKRGRLTISPEEMLKECGYWSDEVDQLNKKHYPVVQDMATTDKLEELAMAMK
ncbi:hypothetical protein CAAN1_10S04588 [[Candida] anglica]|uniref:Thioesterase domain-containing protein n=1 Tax=[Candida] anglica TaxID=148631 RepID=A0ABP0EJ37_9ASCO